MDQLLCIQVNILFRSVVSWSNHQTYYFTFNNGTDKLTHIMYFVCILFHFRRFRYTSYRQFVMWIWGRLGAEVRVPIPSCAVNRIRRSFPSEADYTGFMLSA